MALLLALLLADCASTGEESEEEVVSDSERDAAAFAMPPVQFGERCWSGGVLTIADSYESFTISNPAPHCSLRGHIDSVSTVAISPDGSRALSGSDDTILIYWDLETGQQIAKIEGHTAGISSVAISPDGTRALSVDRDGLLKYWELATERELATLTADDGLNAVAFAIDGNHALTGGADGGLHYWDLVAEELLFTLFGHDEGVESVAISPDGLHALSAGRDKTMRYWSLESGELLDTIRDYGNTILSIAISPNGARALSGGSDGKVKYWDLQRGRGIDEFSGHDGAIFSVAISPDGGRALSVGKDRQIIYWNLEATDRIVTLSGHTGSVMGVAFSADGGFAITGSEDETLKYWYLVQPPTSEPDALDELIDRIISNRRISLALPVISQVPLPPVIGVENNAFETAQEYNLRIGGGAVRRQAQVGAITTEYRRQVEARNAELIRRYSSQERRRLLAESFLATFGAPPDYALCCHS